MADTKNPQSKRNIFPQKEKPGKTQQIHGNVRQDKARFFSARTDSFQPAPLKEKPRARTTNRNSSRTQNNSTLKEKAEQLTLWVKPIVKAEVQRIAQQEGLSVSATGSAFLEKSLQQHIDLHYSAVLQPVIKQAIAHEMRSISTRLAWLLVRVAYDGGQTRSLVTNILGRQPGVTPEILQTILEGSGKTAKANITRRTPQMVELIEAVEQWILASDEEE